MKSTTLQDRLKDAMKEVGMNKTALAKLVNVTQPAISDLCNNPGATSVHLPKIASVLGVRALWLQTGEGPREEKDHFLDGKESELIALYRALPESSQELVRVQIAAWKDQARN